MNVVYIMLIVLVTVFLALIAYAAYCSKFTKEERRAMWRSFWSFGWAKRPFRKKRLEPIEPVSKGYRNASEVKAHESGGKANEYRAPKAASFTRDRTDELDASVRRVVGMS